MARKTPLPQMPRLIKRRDRVVNQEAQVIFDQLKRNSISVVHGHARIVSEHDVEVETSKGLKRYTAQFIFVAVGARPVAPAHLAIDGRVVHDSNTLLGLKKVPKTMVVLGAGVIGCEYASIFSMAGTKVHLVDKRSEILASVDREIVGALSERFSFQGVELHLGYEALEISRKGRIKVLLGRSDAKSKKALPEKVNLATDVVLVAQGRFGNTEGLGLEEVGVMCDDRGLIKVNDHFRTNVQSIFAVGDVIGPPALASTSMEQGRIACCHAFGLPGVDHLNPHLFPYGIYTIPEISMIGRTEEELKKEGVEYVAGKARYRELARGQIVGDRWGLLKLLVDKKSLKLLGVHIVGDNAADLIHIGQAVMVFGGSVHYFIQSVFNYPTLAEAYKTAAFHAVNQIQGKTQTR